MIDILNENFEFDQVDMNNQHFFPPFAKFEMERFDKFRKYLDNDIIHECPKEDQYKLWINKKDFLNTKNIQDKDEEETSLVDETNAEELKKNEDSKIFDVVKEVECGNCYYFRNIDRLRIIQNSIDQVLNLNQFTNKLNDIFECAILLNNHSRYKEKTNKFESKYLIWDRFNIYSEKAQGELIRLMRNFYGEHIGFYFLWYCFLLRFILILMLLSLGIFIIANFQKFFVEKKIFPNYDLSSLDVIYIIYSFIVGLWSTILIKAWKSKESFYAYIWGCENCVNLEPYADAFKPDYRKIFMFTHRIPFQAKWKKTLKQIFSYLILVAMCCATVFIMLQLFKIKEFSKDEINAKINIVNKTKIESLNLNSTNNFYQNTNNNTIQNNNLNSTLLNDSGKKNFFLK